VPFRELRAEILARIRESSGMSTDLELLDKLNRQSDDT
jgi:NitT/TauT family transport system ATP-binding protein